MSIMISISDDLYSKIKDRTDLVYSGRRSESLTTCVATLVKIALDTLNDDDLHGRSGNEKFLANCVVNHAKLGRKPGSARHVVRVEDGVEYNSCMIAAKENGMHFMSIYFALTGKQKTAGGYHWKYADSETINSSEDFLED